MARKAHEEASNEGWKDTYGDMVTLLLCFFVLLYSMSSVSSEKWEAFVKAFTNPGEDTAQVVLIPGEQVGDHEVPGTTDEDGLGVESSAEVPSNFDQLYDYLKDYVEENNMQDSIELAGSEGVVYLRYQNSLFFQPNSAVLTDEARPNLDFLGEALKGLEDQIWLISISGHTASVTGASNVSDWRLSGDRAASVAIHFEEVNGINPKLLRSIGFGKNYPIDTNETAEGREHNRRVEIVIVSSDSPISESPELASAVSGLFQSEKFEEKDKMDSIEQLLDPDMLKEEPDETESGSESAASDSANTPESGSADTPESGSADAPESDSMDAPSDENGTDSASSAASASPALE